MNTETLHTEIQIVNQIDELSRIAGFLDELAEEWDLPMPLVLSINLVLEEALTNVILYGFDDENKHTISIEFGKSGDLLTISIIDDGHEYDPTLKEDPDITLAADERPIGGLGIYLIKKIMDIVEYQRINSKNHLILTKNIKS
jgi:anti-sigma regulatory factor (Ser/Thr protein kinase)